MWQRGIVGSTAQRRWLWLIVAATVCVLGLVAMRRAVRGVLFFAVFAVAFVAAALVGAGRTEAQARTVIGNVTVIDGTGAAPRSGQTVVIEHGRIRSVSESAGASEMENVRRINGTGRFLVPGFIDTHAHVGLGPVGLVDVDGEKGLGVRQDESIGPRSLRTLLAFGVTTIRDPGGPSDVLIDLRDRQRRGDLPGPRMLVAGEVIDRLPFAGLSTQVETTDDVRREVARQAALGVDWIKLYTGLGPEMIAAGIDEAHERGLPVAAHLHETSWTEAAELGVDTLLHLIPGSPKLLGASEAAQLAETGLGSHGFYLWLELVDLSSPRIEQMIEAIVRSGANVDPTSVLFESIFLAGEERRDGLSDLDLAAPSLVENWRTFFHFNIGWQESHYRSARAVWPRALELLGLLHRAGVTLTAGTDANNPWIVPGSSFHRELEIFEEAGIAALEVLSIATRNGAQALGQLDQIGTVEAGKRADLVMLTEDPTVSIGATRSIEWVMQDGRLYDAEDLLRPLRSQESASSR